MNSYALKDTWNFRHQYCTDDVPIEDPAEAQYVRTVHAGHGKECLQLLAAQKAISS